MANYTLDEKRLRKLGFIVPMGGGTDYITVAGVSYIAHETGRLISVSTERINLDDADWITFRADVWVLNLDVIEHVRKNTNLTDAEKEQVVAKLVEDHMVGHYRGHAQSPRKGGKSAEGKTPLEVAETSAVGRALRRAGFGVSSQLATYDEIAIAMNRSDADSSGVVTGPTPITALKAILREKSGGKLIKAQVDKLAKEAYGVENFDALTNEQIGDWLSKLQVDASTTEVPF